MILLFDIGRTKTRVVLSDNGQTWSGEPVIFDTPVDFQVGLNKLLEIVKGEEITLIAGGISRAVWSDINIQSELKKNFNCPVILENDSAVVGLGEMTAGAGQGGAITAYVTVSSGVGGARIVNNSIDKSSFGFEPGHQILLSKDKVPFTLENLISGRSLEANYGCLPYEIDKDDEIWSELALHLAYGLNNIAVCWSPEIIVVGGSMMKIPGIRLNEVRDHFNTILKIYSQKPELKLATLGDIGGLYGALALAKEKLK
ncbi:MAG: ROK family protein [Patescibacteria group bacterium]